jgi:hypothetical protein
LNEEKDWIVGVVEDAAALCWRIGVEYIITSPVVVSAIKRGDAELLKPKEDASSCKESCIVEGVVGDMDDDVA